MLENGRSALLPLVILGAAGTGLQMAETAERTGQYNVKGFLDDDNQKQLNGYCGYPVIGTLVSFADLPDSTLFLSSLYSPKNHALSKKVEDLGIPEKQFATVVDPSAVISRRATIGAGCYVGAGCIIQPNAVIGRCCAFLGNNCIAHDVRVGSHCLFANSACVSGGVTISRNCYIGANSSIRERLTIGEGCVVGMGAVVTKSVAQASVVVGNPAKPMEQR